MPKGSGRLALVDRSSRCLNANDAGTHRCRVWHRGVTFEQSGFS